MVTVNPHPELSPDLREQAAMQTLTYHQMRTVANMLWNLFAAVDHTGEDRQTALAACSKTDERVAQTVFEAFENACLSLEAVYRTTKEG